MLDELVRAAEKAATATSSVVTVGRDHRGSGTVVGDGLVLTSAHSLRGGEITVGFGDGRSATGVVKGVDVDGDLAVVSVDTAGVAALLWPNREISVSIGHPVFVPGAAGAAGSGRVTWGTVSAVGVAFRGPQGRLVTDAFEHTSVVAPGGSGGPVLDADGRLVGINTHRPGGGFYLARPASPSLVERVGALSRGESPARRRLGVALAPPHVARRLRASVGLPERDGVLVREVAADGPAARAGIQKGDLIVQAGDREIDSIDALMAAIEDGGERLALSVVRGTEELSVEADFSGQQ